MKQKKWQDEVRQLGCVVCDHIGLGDETPAELHHLFDADRRNDWLVAPVCTEHHRGKEGIHTLHRRTWQMKYCLTDEDMMAMTIAAMARKL